MRFTSNNTAETETPLPGSEQPGSAARPCEPAPEDVREYIIEETDLTRDEVEQEAQAYRDEFHYSGLSIYYLVALDHGLDPATVFGTRDQEFELEIANIHPGMTVTTKATVKSVSVEDPDNADWIRQDIRIADNSGLIKLVLWNDDIRDDLAAGDEVKLVDCWAKEYRGSPQVSLGKKGRIEIVEDSA